MTERRKSRSIVAVFKECAAKRVGKGESVLGLARQTLQPGAGCKRIVI